MGHQAPVCVEDHEPLAAFRAQVNGHGSIWPLRHPWTIWELQVADIAPEKQIGGVRGSNGVRIAASREKQRSTPS